MRALFQRRSAMLAATLILSAAVIRSDGPVAAADHFDPPTRTDLAVNANADVAADLADLYVFEVGRTATTPSLPLAIGIGLGFAGPRPTNITSTYDRDVLYTIFVSNDADKLTPEFKIQFRLGQDTSKPFAYGIRIEGLPGTTTPLIGPAETRLTTANGIQAIIGLYDDPFNFDAMGLAETRTTGRLSIRNDRNRFTGLNTMALMMQIPAGLIVNGTNPIAAWGTSQRIPAGTAG